MDQYHIRRVELAAFLTVEYILRRLLPVAEHPISNVGDCSVA